MPGSAGRRSARSQTELPFRGVPTGLMAELFATTLDVYLTLGEIPPRTPSDVSTADGRPDHPRRLAIDRLARMVGADREGIRADEDARVFARGDRMIALMARLVAGGKVGRADPGRVRSWSRVRASFWPEGWPIGWSRPGGSGRLDQRRAWGPMASSAACAHALAGAGRGRGTDQAMIDRPIVVVKVGGSLFDWPEFPARNSAEYLLARRARPAGPGRRGRRRSPTR